MEHCVKDEETVLVYPNPLIFNICKYQYAVNWYRATQFIQHIASGISATVPSFKDFCNPETKAIMEKYFEGRAGIPTEHRLKKVELIKDLTSCCADVLTIHAEGSLMAQRLSICAVADFERYKASKRPAKAGEVTGHPLFDRLAEFLPKLWRR